MSETEKCGKAILHAPVTDEEREKYFYEDLTYGKVWRSDEGSINKLLATRTAKAQEGK